MPPGHETAHLRAISSIHKSLVTVPWNATAALRFARIAADRPAALPPLILPPTPLAADAIDGENAEEWHQGNPSDLLGDTSMSLNSGSGTRAIADRLPASGCGPTGERLEWLCLALVLTFASFALPVWLANLSWEWLGERWQQEVDWTIWAPGWQLAYALLLALPAWRRSGLRLGILRSCWGRVALVCFVPVALALTVYPRLPVRPFAGIPIGSWLLGSLVQDLLFAGYLYGRLEGPFPGNVHPVVPIRAALVLAAAFFALWHLPNLAELPTGFVLFQVGYTFVGGIWLGLTRQWTGSILYAAATHVAVNFIASSTG